MAFLSGLDPFLRLFTARPNPLVYFSAAYMASRVEKALAAFAAVVSNDTGYGPFLAERRNAIGCLGILSKFITEAANVATWEVFPCSVFFAPAGEYEATFMLNGAKKRKQHPTGNTLTPPAVPTTPIPKCFVHCLFTLSPPTQGKPWPKCFAQPCRRSHNLRSIKGSREDFVKLVNEAVSYPNRSVLAAAIATDTKKLSFLV